MKVKEIVSKSEPFWVNEDDFADRYESIEDCPDADKEVKYITWDGEGELVLEV